MKKILLLSLVLISWLSQTSAQEKKFSISGEIKDAKNGEELIGASIAVPSLKLGVTTNAYGFYSLSLPDGTYDIEISYLGYVTE